VGQRGGVGGGGGGSEDVELNEGLAERRRILADARALKDLAGAFLHPEQPVATEGAAFGRNYFDRPSALETEDDDFADERAEVLAEAAALKKLATDYLHPEAGVVATAAAAFGRNYFNRYSAAETGDREDEVASVDAKDALLWFAN